MTSEEKDDRLIAACNAVNEDAEMAELEKDFAMFNGDGLEEIWTTPEPSNSF